MAVKIKMLTAMGGTVFHLAPGDVYECDEAEAGRLIEVGYAVPYDEKSAARERAVRSGPAETR